MDLIDKGCTRIADPLMKLTTKSGLVGPHIFVGHSLDNGYSYQCSYSSIRDITSVCRLENFGCVSAIGEIYQERLYENCPKPPGKDVPIYVYNCPAPNPSCTYEPTLAPTSVMPSKAPIGYDIPLPPTRKPTYRPTKLYEVITSPPTSTPSLKSEFSTNKPTRFPSTTVPTSEFKPSLRPTRLPTFSMRPSEIPTEIPTELLTKKPTRAKPTKKPSSSPTKAPTEAPTENPTEQPFMYVPLYNK